MSKYIDAEKLIAELTKLQFTLNASYRKPQSDNIVRAISLEYDDILSIVGSLQQEQPEANEVEKALSLQIQAYLTTASDELYAPGKPLYTKEHHEGIHECMKMWQKTTSLLFLDKARTAGGGFGCYCKRSI